MKPQSIPPTVLLEPRAYIEALLWIRDKHKRIIPLHFNGVQATYYEGMPFATAQAPAGERKLVTGVREIVLKFRQPGFSTLIEGLIFFDTITNANTYSAIISHDGDSSQKLGSPPRVWGR